MAKKKTESAIKTHMDHPLGSTSKVNRGKLLEEHPHKLAKGEVSNLVDRPPKR